MLKRMTTEMALLYYSDKPHDEGDVEIYAYGLERLISSRLQFFFFILLGFAIGELFTTIAFLTAYMTIRTSIGGYHAKTHIRCFFTFFVIYAAHISIIHLIPIELINSIALLLAVIPALPIFLYAPLEDINRPTDDEERKAHRKKSIIKYLIQTLIIVGFALTGVLYLIAESLSSATGILRHVIGFPPFILLSFSLGQLSAACMLVVAKIRDRKRIHS